MEIKRRKYLDLDEIVRIFSDPNLLHNTIREWEKAEPNSMKEILSKIPNPSAREVIRETT